MNELLLLGASGLAREVIAADHPYSVIGILDDNPANTGTEVGGVPVLGGVELAADHAAQLLVCVGNGVARAAIVGHLRALGVHDDRYATVVDASVRVPPSCTIGAGSILMANVVLTADVTVGRHVVVMPQVTLTHDNVLEDYVTIAAGVALGGGVQLQTGAYLGMNASVRQNVRIGVGARIGMGAVVLTDVPAGETWAGIPAQRLGVRV